MRVVRLERKLVNDEPRHRDATPGRRLHLTDLGADHHARQRRGGLLTRISCRNLLAAAGIDRHTAAKYVTAAAN